MSVLRHIWIVATRIGVGLVAAVTGVLVGAAIQVAGSSLVGLPGFYLPWLVGGLALAGFVIGVIFGTRKIAVWLDEPFVRGQRPAPVAQQDLAGRSSNAYPPPTANQTQNAVSRLPMGAYLHAACDGCAWFLLVSVVAGVVVFFVTGWPSVATSPVGFWFRCLAVCLVALTPAILAAGSFLRNARPH